MRQIFIRQFQRKLYDELKATPFIVKRQHLKTHVVTKEYIVIKYTPELEAQLETNPLLKEDRGLISKLFHKNAKS